MLLCAAILAAAGAFAVVGITRDDSSSQEPLRRALRAATPATSPFVELTATELGIGNACVKVLIADDEAERVDGLRGRSDLGPYDAMLFVFPADSGSAFTMSGVPVTLEIGFYAADGTPVSRTTMRPCAEIEARCPIYEADGVYRYAVETLRGGLGPGTLSGCP